MNLPLHFHTFRRATPSVLDKATGPGRRAAFFTVVSGFQMNLVNIVAAVAWRRVERYPNIRARSRRERHRLAPCARPHGLQWEDRAATSGSR